MADTEGSAVSPSSSSSGVTKSVGSGDGVWLDAYHDPVASLYTFSTCVAMGDLLCDGEHRLVIGHLGKQERDIKLKFYRGTQIYQEIPLLEMPTAVEVFMLHDNEAAVAVSAATYIYIYKGLRPYYKFALPILDVNKKEAELWQQLKEDKIDATMLRDSLETMSADGCDPPLTVRSMRMLQLLSDDLQPFTTAFKQTPLRRQTVVVALSVLRRTHSDETSAMYVVLGTENKDIYVLDPVGFTFLTKLQVPAVPVFISATGVFDVEYYISVSCRDACIYTIRRQGTSSSGKKLLKISLGSQPCGMVRMNKEIVVGCMDNTLASYTAKGRRQWVVTVPDTITAMALMDHRLRNFQAVLVALRNGEIRVYKDRFIVNTITVEDPVVGMRFGQFGREAGALILVSQGGALSVKILKRNVNFEVKDSSRSVNLRQLSKLSIPKKTKVFVDQTIRERENAIMMHQTFQQDLVQLRLKVARMYANVLTSRMLPISSTVKSSLKVSAQVHGIGPIFRLTVTLQNTSPSSSATDLYLAFKCDSNLYDLDKNMIMLPMLVPSLSYKFDVKVQCLDDFGRSDSIKVFVLKKGNPVPLLTAVIDMPVSENFVV